MISGLWIAIDQNKVAPIHLRPMPTNVKEMQSFLGFASYYRKYIEDFALISGPLYKLLSKDVVFEMTDARITAWNRLKEKLTTAPILGLPDWNLPFLLYVDASFDGLGAALHQVQYLNNAPKEMATCFISRTLRNGELRYGATQLECL